MMCLVIDVLGNTNDVLGNTNDVLGNGNTNDVSFK